MSYKKQLAVLFVGTLTVIFAIVLYLYVNAIICNTVFSCIEVAIYGAPYQYYFLLLSSFLLALIPLFFTKENVYIAWRKFTVFALPAMALLVLLTPNSVGAGWINFGIDKETVSMFLSVVFLFVSWGLIAFKARHI